MKFPLGAKIGLFFGLLGGLAGLTVALIMAPIVGLLVAVPTLIVFWLLYAKIFRPMMQANKLLETGIQARAEIKEMWDTGWTVNEQPRIGLLLVIQPEGRLPYEAKTTMIISRLQAHLYQPGTELTVRYDPNAPEKVVVEAVGYQDARQNAADTAALQAELEELDRVNRDINEFGVSATAIVMDVTELAQPVRGQVHYLKLRVKVLPEGGAPYSAELKGLFAKTSLHKYEAGKEIKIKHDKYKRERISVEFGQ